MILLRIILSCYDINEKTIDRCHQGCVVSVNGARQGRDGDVASWVHKGWRWWVLLTHTHTHTHHVVLRPCSSDNLVKPIIETACAFYWLKPKFFFFFQKIGQLQGIEGFADSTWHITSRHVTKRYLAHALMDIGKSRDATCRACRAARRNTQDATSATSSRSASVALTH